MATSAELFHSMSRAREQLEAQLSTGGALENLRRAVQPGGVARTRVARLPASAGGGRLGATPLWHFMARFPQRRQVSHAYSMLRLSYWTPIGFPLD